MTHDTQVFAIILRNQNTHHLKKSYFERSNKILMTIKKLILTTNLNNCPSITVPFLSKF